MKVLIAEDDPITLETVEACLAEDGFITLTAKNGKEALERWERDKPDFVCLDIMMPLIDGYEVCRRIRARDPKLPILFLSAKNEEIDVVVGLELGADDFVRKPFGRHELLARIRNVLRRMQAIETPNATDFFFLGGEHIQIYPKQLRGVLQSGKDIDLTPREIAILELLYTRRGEAVHRDQLLDHCWGIDYYPESRTLDQHIAKLRKRIEPDPENPTIIETVRGVGYRIR